MREKQVVPIENVVNGSDKRSIYIVPEDGKDLKRRFRGCADGTSSERLLTGWATLPIVMRF